MGKPRHALLVIALLGIAALAVAYYWHWANNAPRRDSVLALTQLNTALHAGGDPAAMLDLLVLPSTVKHRSVREQIEFITKTLNDEISAEGLAALKRHGSYGPLKEIFPTDAETWAQRAGAKAEDCVAFKMERGGVRCEVVLVKPSTPNAQPSAAPPPYRILRVNNVKQMADSQLLATETKR